LTGPSSEEDWMFESRSAAAECILFWIGLSTRLAAQSDRSPTGVSTNTMIFVVDLGGRHMVASAMYIGGDER